MDLHTEVPFLTFHTIQYHAERLLAEVQPDALARSEPLDIRHLIETWLPLRDVEVRVGSADEMGEVEAWTDFSPSKTELVLREDQMEALYAGSDRAWRAKAGVGHEVGHIVLGHGDRVACRLQQSSDHGGMRLGCAEWQAWAFCGCLMMPVPVLQSLVLTVEQIDEVRVSKLFDVSPQLAYRHLLRAKQANLL